MSTALSVVRRWLPRILLTIVGLVAGWLLVANLYLNTIGPSTISRHPERWKISWDRAWMTYPGRVYVDGFRYEQHIGRNDILVTANKATGTIPLRPLLEKRFCVAGINADGVRVLLDRRPPPKEPPKPRAPAKPRKPGWIIELRDVNVSTLDEFAFKDISITGGSIATVTGSWQTQLGGNMEIRDAVLKWKDARMQVRGGASNARSISIGFRGGFSPFSPRVDRGMKSLTHLSGDLSIKGHVVTLAFLSSFFSGSGWISGIDGAGMIDAQLRMRDGRVVPESKIDVTAEKLSLDFMDFHAAGAGHVAVLRSATKNGDDTHVELLLDRFDFRRATETKPLARGKNLRFDARAANLRFGMPFQGGSVVIDVPESEVPDVSILGSWLPEPLGLTLQKGRATLRAHLESPGRGQNARGEFRLTGTGLAGKFRDLDFKFDMSLETKISGTKWHDLEVQVDGTQLRVKNGTFTAEGIGVEPDWWMTLGVSKGRLSFRTPLRAAADVDLAMRDARAIVAVFAELKSWMSKVDGILRIKDIKGHTRIALAEKRLEIDGLTLSGTKFASEGDVSLGNGPPYALLWLKYRRIDVAFEWAGPKKEWDLVGERKWYDAKHAARHGGAVPVSEVAKK